jgi:hypothetical protein
MRWMSNSTFTGAKDICGLIVHVFAVELRCVERSLGAAAMPYEQFPTGRLEDILYRRHRPRQTPTSIVFQVPNEDHGH